ncbi:hypothetical protein N7527_007653 [Penicillium freii]|nr:hypothetical protein N7527_007653 [Penicillium freii]
MKVILTGSTGFVGGEVLSQCLAHPAITSIVALSRRDLPAHKKLKVALIEDFMTYPDSIRDDIRDAEACIWTLGKAYMPDNDIARRVSLDYTLAAAQVFKRRARNRSGSYIVAVLPLRGIRLNRSGLCRSIGAFGYENIDRNHQHFTDQ